MPRYPLLPNCVFREDFTNPQAVAQNDGVVTGAPTISNGYTTTAANAQSIYYPKRRGVLNGATKFVIDLDFTTGSDITTATRILSEWDASGTIQFLAQIISGNFIFYLGDAANYGLFAMATNTRYRIRISYDGSQATNALKLVCYKDGSAQALTFGGTIPTSVSVSLAYIMTFNGTNGSASTHVSGFFIRSCSIFKGVSSTVEEALDAYQQDTITELDASKALVYLPLKSWYYKENGTQLLTDGDMEAVGVTAWTAFNCNLTKETGTRTGGTGTKVLRLTSTGVSAAAYQSASVTVGKTYRITGWARSVDGVGQPYLDWVGGAASWIGTVSTSWQYFDCMLPAEPAGGVALRNFGGAGSAVEYDDVKTELCIAQTKNIGSLGGYALLGDGSTTTTFPTQLNPHGMSFDGGDYLNIDMGIGPLLTLSTPFTFSVLMYDDKGLSDTTNYSIGGTWDTAQSKGILFYKYSSASYGPGVLIGSSSGNFIEARGKEAPPGTHLYTFTYDGSGTFAGLRIYIDGKLSSWINGSTGTLGADIVSGKGVILGARWNGAASPHQFLTSGKRILDVSIYPFVLTPVQVKGLYERLKKLLNV